MEKIFMKIKGVFQQQRVHTGKSDGTRLSDQPSFTSPHTLSFPMEIEVANAVDDAQQSVQALKREKKPLDMIKYDDEDDDILDKTCRLAMARA